MGSSNPMLLYKFLTPERLDVLEKGLIRFTQPAALNDPFESRPRNFKAEGCGHLTQRGDWQCIKSYIDEVQTTFTSQERKSVGLLCLAENSTNIPMWAHYAAEHRGFVLGFENSHDFFAKKSDGTGLWKVRYSDERPFRPANDVLDYLSSQPGPHTTGLIDVVFGTAPTFNPDTYPDDYRFVKSCQ